MTQKLIMQCIFNNVTILDQSFPYFHTRSDNHVHPESSRKTIGRVGGKDTFERIVFVLASLNHR